MLNKSIVPLPSDDGGKLGKVGRRPLQEVDVGQHDWKCCTSRKFFTLHSVRRHNCPSSQ